MNRRQESSADCDAIDLMGDPNFLCKVSLPGEQSTDNYLITQFMLIKCLPSDSCINFSIASLNCRVKSQCSFEEVNKQPKCIYTASIITTTNAYDYLWLSTGSNRDQAEIVARCLLRSPDFSPHLDLSRRPLLLGVSSFSCAILSEIDSNFNSLLLVVCSATVR
ncbi:hypothetical protein VNO77_27213 [Canavalia gladiata]|uniref:Uncharacterized protein n=1 Tax=Canavalia gladiata TaxID=3824 RepID=A0AAN9KYF5_CANGL